MRQIGLVLSSALLMVMVACAQGETGAQAEALAGDTTRSRPILSTDEYADLPCRVIGNPEPVARFVSSSGDILRLTGGLQHEFEVRAGVVPDGSQYLYVFAIDEESDDGCRVLIDKVSPGPILTDIPNPYRLQIHCDHPGGGSDPCDSSTKILRKEPYASPVGGIVEQGNQRWVQTDLRDLSTYALGAPIRLDEEAPPPDENEEEPAQ